MEQSKRITLPNHVLMAEVQRLLLQGTMVTIRTKGNSMLPFIEGERDSVVLSAYGTPKIGDIALAKLDNGIYVLHRIINITSAREVTLMGDGNIKGKEYCLKEQLCGKVIAILRNGKEYNPESLSWKMQAIMWRKLLPVRRWLLAIYRRVFI